MSVINEYRFLYNQLISDRAKVLIVSYDARKHQYEYRPYSHQGVPDALDTLSDLIVDNMVFYSFSEEEIVDQHNKFGLLDDLKNAAKYAYELRLPKRLNAKTDGTTGEVLLDIIIQVFEPISQKMIARAKYKQQGDNNEIKGYDALYFTDSDDGVALWLGQVKTGSYSYCRNSIVDDLNSKYILDYFCKSIFYIADKLDRSNTLAKVLGSVNKICFESIKNNWSDDQKKQTLINYLKKQEVKVKIPCLLAFTSSIYKESSELSNKIEQELRSFIDEIDTSDFLIANEIEHELMFIIFPLEDINKLRDNIVKFKKP
ncbi:Hachiman antiphage defense system protein HamA [Paenibacillus sp. BAC0078]